MAGVLTELANENTHRRQRLDDIEENNFVSSCANTPWEQRRYIFESESRTGIAQCRSSSALVLGHCCEPRKVRCAVQRRTRRPPTQPTPSARSSVACSTPQISAPVLPLPAHGVRTWLSRCSAPFPQHRPTRPSRGPGNFTNAICAKNAKRNCSASSNA